MYSVFRSPALVERKNIQTENNVTARKPGQLSARKPFAERLVNLKENGTPIVVKPQVILKPVVNEEPSFDLSELICSYKEVKDTYNDIYNEKYFLTEKGLKNLYSCILGNGPENLPVLEDSFEPEHIDEYVREDEKFNSEADEVCSLFKNDYDMNFDEVPFPELDFEI